MSLQIETDSEWNPYAKLEAENAMLKAELKAINAALDDPQTDITMTACEVISALKEQLSEANKERAWVRRKLEIPEDAGFLSGEVTLAGTMHNVCAHAAGYDKYVESYKCDDKQGEIARLTVTCNALKEQVAQLQGSIEELTRKYQKHAGNYYASQDALAKLQSKSAALVDALEKAARHVRPTCDELYYELNAALAAFKEGNGVDSI